MNLKRLMFENNIKQNELAKEMHINTTTLNNYVNHKTEPDINTLIALADRFNVSLDYLCERTWNNNIGYIPAEKKEVVKIILQLNEINTIKILGYASGLLAGQS